MDLLKFNFEMDTRCSNDAAALHFMEAIDLIFKDVQTQWILDSSLIILDELWRKSCDFGFQNFSLFSVGQKYFLHFLVKFNYQMDTMCGSDAAALRLHHSSKKSSFFLLTSTNAALKLKWACRREKVFKMNRYHLASFVSRSISCTH